jgi:transposase
VDVLISWVDAEGDITMPELADRLFNAHGVKAHPASLSRLLRAHGYTFKKNSTGARNRSR